jgi:exonuclease SbcD
MNKAKLKSYAPQARKDFIAAVEARAHSLGLSEMGGTLDIAPSEKKGDVTLIAGQAWPAKVHDQRQRLIKRMKKDGFAQTVEAVAYTWFSRIAQVALTAQDEWLASTSWCFDSLPAGARALFTCIPTVNKAVVAATVGAADAAQAVGEHLTLLLRGYAPTHRAARRQGVPTIGVCHGTVFGCLSEHGVPMAGFDHEFTTGALFGAEAQAFMLGHIHRHQAWEQQSGAGRQCIAYPGSIGRFHYGEEGGKGFLFWEIDADQARFTLEPTPACRTVDIVFESQPDLDALRAAVAQQDIAGAFVRVRWTVAEEDRHQVDRAAIERLLEGAAETKLEGRILPVVRTRAAGISQLANLADKVRVWAQVTEARAEPLLACLQALASQEPEAIAERVLRGQEVPDGGECIDTAVTLSPPRADLEPALSF